MLRDRTGLFLKTSNALAEKTEFQTSVQSVYFDELEHEFVENGEKQHTSQISNARETSRLYFKICDLSDV